MRHLTNLEIENPGEHADAKPELREHLASCALCQERARNAQRLELALGELTKVEPAADLSARIIATLPKQANGRHPTVWLGAACLFAALAGLALTYETAFTLRSNGVFELVSFYTAQPEIVTMYPNEAWGALAGAIPWLTVAFSLVTLALALALAYRWTGRTARVMG
jgi:hypothetical protein